MSILLKCVYGIWIIVTRHYRNPKKYGVTKYGYFAGNVITSDKAVDYRRALNMAQRRWHK